MSHWSCGWEAGDLAYYQAAGFIFDGPTTNIITTAGQVHKSFNGRGGVRSLHLEDDMRTPVFGTGGRWFHFWMGVNPNNLNAQPLSVEFHIGGSANFTVSFTVSGFVELRRGNATSTVIGTGSYNPGVPHWVAIEANLQNSPNGQVTVKVDGVQVAQVTAADTQATASPAWDQIVFNSNNIGIAIDDLIVTTAAEGELGEHFLPQMLPVSNDLINSEATSTGGAGTFANVDEVPPDEDASYNEFTVANKDRYGMANLGWTPASIHAVTIWGYAARDGTLTQAELICATDTAGGGVTEAFGDINGLASAGVYASWMDTFNVDPDTGVAWSPAGLDDLRAGVRWS